MDNKQAIAALLTEQMEQRNWSYRDLAARTGISPATVGVHVNARSLPTSATLRKYADALGLPHHYLMVVAGHDEPTTDMPPDLEAIVAILRSVWGDFTPSEREMFWVLARAKKEQQAASRKRSAQGGG